MTKRMILAPIGLTIAMLVGCGSQKVQVEYVMPLAAPLDSMGTYLDGRLYMCDREGHVLCIDPLKGGVLWRHDSPTEDCLIDLPVHAGLVASRAGVLVGYPTGVVESLDPTTGQVRWTWRGRDGPPTLADLALRRDELLVGESLSGAVVRIDVVSGQWRQVEASAALVTGQRGAFVVRCQLDVENRLRVREIRPIWSASEAAVERSRCYLGPRVEIFGRGTYVVNALETPGAAVCRDVKTGTMRWRATPGRRAVSAPSGRSLTEERVLALHSLGDRVLVVGAKRILCFGTEGMLWAADADLESWAVRDMPPPVQLAGSLMFLAEGNGTLTALRTYDGAVVWSARAGMPIAGGFAIGEGKVYFANSDNWLCAVEIPMSVGSLSQR